MGLTADLCDIHRNKVKLAQPLFTLHGSKREFSGPVHTVQVLDDNVLVKEALKTIPSGSVLVIDGGGSRNVALMGDNLAEIAVERDLAGIILYGCIRDSGEIKDMDTGIFAIGTTPFKSIKEGKGQKDIPVQFAGITWNPGSYVYADEDGILLADEKLSTS